MKRLTALTSAAPSDTAASGINVEQILSSMSLEKFLYTLVIVVAGLLAVKLILRLLDRMLIRAHPTMAKLIRIAAKVVLLFVLVLIVMDFLSISVTSLIALLSVASLAISLAAQNFLANVAGGLQIITSQPFQIGNFVEAGGCSGTVKEIGLFYTKLTSIDNKLVQLPNSTIVAANIINYSAEDTRRVDWTVTASYDAPTQLVTDTLYALVTGTPGVLEDPAPKVYLSNYGASSIEYVIRVWCATKEYWDVYYAIVGGCKDAFDRAGIEMTYDHLNVHLVRPAEK